jgi:carbon monoxide dehydrogenase subunit G
VGVAVRIGPVSAKFNGKITLGDMNPPNSYTLTFDGQGGAAGFGKGTAHVTLTPNEAGCELGYAVHAQVGGKVAQLGQRLVDGAAKTMAEDFFKRFDDEMQRRYPPVQAPLPPAATVSAASGGAPAWVWLVGALSLAVIWWFAR